MSNNPVPLNILDRQFLVACAPEERDGLLQAARLLDTRMREVRANARTPGFDRLAILAALGISHELLVLQQESEAGRRRVAEKVAALDARLGHALPDSIE